MFGRFNFNLFTTAASTARHQTYYDDLVPQKPLNKPQTEINNTLTPNDIIINTDNNLLSSSHKKSLKAKTNPFHRALKIIGGSIGLCAAALYFGPAETCTKLPHCGGWMVDLFRKLSADEEVVQTATTYILAGGGADFAFGASLMGAKSIDALIEYLKDQPTLAQKILKGGLVISFAATQSLGLAMTSLKTATKSWHTILTLTGNVPPVLYGSTFIFKEVAPNCISIVKTRWADVCFHMTKCISVTETELQARKKILFYREQHKQFIEKIQAKYRYIQEHSRSIAIPKNNELSPLDYLLQFEDVEKDGPWLAKGIHQLGVLAGLLLALDFGAGSASNAFHVLSTIIPTIPLQVLTTLILMASKTYSDIKYTILGVTGILDTFIDVLRGKPIHSLAFQLRPKTMALAAFASILLSIFSHAVLTVLNLKEFTNEFAYLNPSANMTNIELTDAQKGLLYGCISGIDIYHFGSLIHFFYMLLSILTKDQREQFLFAVEAEVNRLLNMTEEQFIAFYLSKNPQTDTEQSGFFRESDIDVTQPLLVQEKNTFSDGPSLFDIESLHPSAAAQKKSNPAASEPSWCRWFSCFSSKENNNADQPSNIPVSTNRYNYS